MGRTSGMCRPGDATECCGWLSPTPPSTFSDIVYDAEVTTPIRVLLAEDDPLAQMAIQTYLSRAGDMELVATAGDGVEALGLLEEARPDVAIVDLHMPRLDGVELTSRLTAANPPVKVLIFTALGDDDTLARALQAGASGFLLKSDSPGLVLHGIRSAHSGDSLVSPKLVASLLRRGGVAQSAPPASVTETDRRLLGLVALGLSNAEIASEMFLAPSTVKTYISRLLARLDRPNRAALAALAYEWDLVPRDHPA